jgi:glycosyltransferase involved in cell wall biosynthesis
VTVVDASRGPLSRAKRDIARTFHQILRGYISPFDSNVFLPEALRRAFSEKARSLSPVLSVITYVAYAGLISCLPPGTATILDPIDIYHRVHRAYADETPLKKLLAPIRFGYREELGVYDAERRILARYDGILAISREDQQAYLEAGLDAQRIGFLEACVQDMATTPSASEVPKDLDILFIGARFAGTEKGLAFLLREVLPLLARPVRIAVVGRLGEVVPQHSTALHPNVSVETPGIVEDVRPYYDRARLVALPIPVGTGTSVKMQEAFSRGACVVTTTAGGRIQGVIDNQNCLVRDDPAAFAQAIEHLLDAPSRRASLGAAALQTARRYYSLEAVHAYLDDFILRRTGLDPRGGLPWVAEKEAIGLE